MMIGSNFGVMEVNESLRCTYGWSSDSISFKTFGGKAASEAYNSSWRELHGLRCPY